MSFLENNLLSILIFSPLVLGASIFLIPKANEVALRIYATAASFIVFLLSCLILYFFDSNVSELQLVEKQEWLPTLGVNYFLGIDGLSLFLVLLTTFLLPLIFLSSFNYIKNRFRSYAFYMLALESGILGAFLSLDLFLFYVFWEAMLLPMFFIIGVWGGTQKIYAATKFILYTVVGSVPMLVAIIFLLWQHSEQFGYASASIIDLYGLTLSGNQLISAQGLIFFAFALAFAVKVPMFPLHTWLPDAHVQAPTGGSVILAGVLLKLGVYGFMRFAMPLSPSIIPLVAPFVMYLSAAAIVYGAIVALVQTDIKKLVAYSSVSHMGYVMMGLFAMNEIGVTGSVYQMLNHGISTGGLFFIVGLLYERRHTRDIDSYSGMAKTVPLISIAMLIFTFSSIALPGTNGFIGEFLILQGSFLTNWGATIIAGTGVVLGAVYMLWLCQRILFGEDKQTSDKNPLIDLNLREFVYLSPLLILVFVMGVFPSIVINRMKSSVNNFVQGVNSEQYSLSIRKEKSTGSSLVNREARTQITGTKVAIAEGRQ